MRIDSRGTYEQDFSNFPDWFCLQAKSFARISFLSTGETGANLLVYESFEPCADRMYFFGHERGNFVAETCLRELP